MLEKFVGNPSAIAKANLTPFCSRREIRIENLAGAAGFEPATCGFGDRLNVSRPAPRAPDRADFVSENHSLAPISPRQEEIIADEPVGKMSATPLAVAVLAMGASGADWICSTPGVRRSKGEVGKARTTELGLRRARGGYGAEAARSYRVAD